MKLIRCLSILLSLVFLAGCSKQQEPPLLMDVGLSIDVGLPIEAPVALNNAMVTLTISDLQGFLDEFGAVVSQVNPMMGGPVLKTLLGSQLGDPQLTGFAPGKGLAVVVLNPTNVFAVAEVEPAQAATYIQSLEAKGLVAKQQEGLLLIAQDEKNLVAAESMAVQVQAGLLEAKREASLRISVRPAELIAKNEEWITTGLQQMLAKMEQASVSNQVMDVQKILEAELQVALSLGRQVDTFEETLAPIDGAVLIREVLQPVAGSRLAACCNAPALYDYNPLVQAGMLPAGVIEMEYCMRNPDALLAFLNGEVANLVEVMDFDPALATQWTECMNGWMSAMGSTVCESMFTADGKPFGISMLEEVKDESAMLEALRSLSSDLDTLGFSRLYESMGMPMTVKFEENVRTADGINIHRLGMDFELKNIPPEQAEILESMLGDMSFDLAIYKDVLIYTTGEGAVEKIIEQMKSGGVPASTLAARAAFPSGGFYYADFDVGGYLGCISSSMDEVPDASAMVDKFTAVMQGAEPVVMTGYCNNGRLKFCSKIPADLLVRAAQAGQMMALETMQKKTAMQTTPAPQSPAGPAPDGTLQLLDGSAVPLSGFTGQKVVVLDFWASWCGPCRKGLPMVQAVSDYFTGRDVVFYAVNLREDIDKVKPFFDGAGLSLPVALDDGTLSEAFGVTGIPHTVVIGKDGNIKSVHTGFSPDLDVLLTAEINTALAE